MPASVMIFGAEREERAMEMKDRRPQFSIFGFDSHDINCQPACSFLTDCVLTGCRKRP